MMFNELRRVASGLVLRLAIRLWPAERASDAPVFRAFHQLAQAMVEEAYAI